MAVNKIQDLAYNILTTGSTSQFLGFQSTKETKKLDLEMYRFLTNNIRLEDSKTGFFLKRYIDGFQQTWETTNNHIYSLKTLWDYLNIEDDFLPYLKNIVGWTDDLSKITENLDYDTLRKLISVSVAFWKSRSSESTTINILELLTKAQCRIWNWFDFRWVVGETHLGEEHQGIDPHIIDIPGTSLSSEYNSNLRIVDDGYLNHDLVKNIVKLTRPVGERITVTYLSFMDLFSSNLELWDVISGSLTIEDGLAKFSSIPSDCVLANIDGSNLWYNYQLYVKIRGTGNLGYIGCIVYGQGQGVGLSNLNGYFVSLDIYYNSIRFFKIVSGSLTALALESYDPYGILDFNIWYGLRVLSTNDESGNANFDVYLDNDLIMSVSDNTWTQGTVGLLHNFGNSTFECDEVEVLKLPSATDYIDINQ
jgi:hypothetical protein